MGKDVSIEDLRANSDALVLTLGSTVPRDLRIPNRDAQGIHFAMEFLTKNQKRLMMTREGKLESGWDRSFVTAEGKDVIVVGGGDTGTVRMMVVSWVRVVCVIWAKGGKKKHPLHQPPK